MFCHNHIPLTQIYVSHNEIVCDTEIFCRPTNACIIHTAIFMQLKHIIIIIAGLNLLRKYLLATYNT